MQPAACGHGSGVRQASLADIKHARGSSIVSQIPEEFGYPGRDKAIGRICDLPTGPPLESSVTLPFRLFHSDSCRFKAFAWHEKEVLPLLQPTIVGEILPMPDPDLAANFESRASGFFSNLADQRGDGIFARANSSSLGDPEVPNVAAHLHQQHDPVGGEKDCTSGYLHRNLLQEVSSQFPVFRVVPRSTSGMRAEQSLAPDAHKDARRRRLTRAELVRGGYPAGGAQEMIVSFTSDEAIQRETGRGDHGNISGESHDDMV